MKAEAEFSDVVYFGYDWSPEAGKNRQDEKEFIAEINLKFPEVKLVDAYDNIKGFRQEVHLPETKKDEYYIWIIATGRFGCSLTLIMIAMMPDKTQQVHSYLAQAKEQYPENFK